MENLLCFISYSEFFWLCSSIKACVLENWTLRAFSSADLKPKVAYCKEEITFISEYFLMHYLQIY